MVNINVKRSLGTIVKYLLFVNILSLIISIFYFSKSFFIGVLSFNVFMLALYVIFVKFEYMLFGIVETNRIARTIDKFAGKING